MSASGECVFVYGTLRRGASNAHRMDGATYLGEAAVHGRLYLVETCREFVYPALVPDSEAARVVGELFEVPARVLASLDTFEGREYDRIKLPLVNPEHLQRGEAWVWVWNGVVSGLSPIESGDWFEVS